MSEALAHAAVLKGAGAGALALAFGGAPLGVLLVGRRMSLMGDALSHAILPGAAIAYIVAGPDPWALTLGALAAALVVAGLSTLLAHTRRLPEDAAFAVFYLAALAVGVLVIGREAEAETLHALLFGAPQALDAQGLILAAGVATVTLLTLAAFIRGFLAESADPVFMRASGLPGRWLHLVLMALVALNLVAGFKAFGALMTVGLMMIPAIAARFWARSYVGQALFAVGISALASGAGLALAGIFGVEPGPAMTLSAASLFAVSAAVGRNNGLLRNLPGRGHLEG